MHHFYLKILAPNSPLICVPQTLWRPLFTVVDGEHLQPATVQSSSRVSCMKNLYHLCPIPNSTLRVHSSGSLQFSSSQIRQHFQFPADRGSYEDESRDKEILVDSFPESTETLGHEDCKELIRRRKISVANKGKKPWNKGIKHSPDIREKIKQRTTEALGNPKVRKKMSERPRRAHSEEIKAKISIATKQVWKKRLKIRRIKEKLYLRWEESIAEAAKIGWSDQQELVWDSYEKMHEELICQQIQRAEDKVKAKEIAKLRAAKERKEKMAKLAQRREEREQLAIQGFKIRRKNHQDMTSSGASNSTAATSTTSKAPVNSVDIGYEYCTVEDLNTKQFVTCNFCKNRVSSITRFKHHLVHKRGDVTGCPGVPLQVQVRIQKLLDVAQAKKNEAARVKRITKGGDEKECDVDNLEGDGDGDHGDEEDANPTATPTATLTSGIVATTTTLFG